MFDVVACDSRERAIGELKLNFFLWPFWTPRRFHEDAHVVELTINVQRWKSHRNDAISTLSEQHENSTQGEDSKIAMFNCRRAQIESRL